MGGLHVKPRSEDEFYEEGKSELRLRIEARSPVAECPTPL